MAQIGASLVLLTGIGVAAAIVIRHRLGDDSRIAVAQIETAPSAPVVASAPVTPMAATAPTEPVQGVLSGSSVEVQNGVKIIRFNGGTSSASVTIPVSSDEAVALAPAPDPRVSETTAEGLLPRIGPMGARASSVYARHDPAAKGPLIALVLVDLGQDPSATADAARRLPAAVSFGLVPEMSDGTAQAAEIRRLGHEALLDLREPEGGAAANADPARALRRRLGRWPGYVGVVLAPGAPQATAEEAGRRGLLSMAPASTLGVTRAIDVVADAAQGQPALSSVLARLVDIAKAKGSALGMIDHAALAGGGLATALASLGSQPVTLVSATALMSRAGAVDASR